MFTLICKFLSMPKELKKIMSQIDELRELLTEQNEVIADEVAEVRTKFDALEARITELLGTQTPDITDLLDGIRASIDNIESISGDVEEVDEEPLVEEVPAEEPVV